MLGTTGNSNSYLASHMAQSIYACRNGQDNMLKFKLNCDIIVDGWRVCLSISETVDPLEISHETTSGVYYER